ncbi:G-protein coupled receptor GRL101 [Procambarus clarkii]|uniref:G-protein coupled receptor GRL101 n=1 Tax=Procambarus clarkii TaxID=6728 RepID=UPI00374226F4
MWSTSMKTHCNERLSVVAGVLLPVARSSASILPGGVTEQAMSDNTHRASLVQAAYKNSLPVYAQSGLVGDAEGEDLATTADGGVSCPPGMWCSNGSRCVPQNATCSGLAECPDESNEAVTLCGCLPDEYQCRNTCIDALKRCDTESNCDGGEDEQHCETWVCPASHYKCTNGLCVPSYAVCNFVDDCHDNSDEQQCHYRKCFYGEFRCANGECVRPGLVCDGHKDCIDGTDETQCQPEDFVVCASRRRVHRFFWCDGWPDCADTHADELNCGECEEHQFRCPDSQCVSAGNVCDSQCDCTDCADERDCGRFYTRVSGVAVCEVGQAITCVVSANQRHKDRCVAADRLCDGFNHCHNGDQLSDETGCALIDDEREACRGAGQEGAWFTCSDGRCLPARLRCDRKMDCLKGEDESDCVTVECAAGEWQCVSGQCISEALRCDLHFDCYDKTDELNCSSDQCGSGQAKCHTGQCLPLSYWCDHIPDCPDQSDELYCGEKGSECGPEEFLCASGRQCIPMADNCIVPTDRHHGCADGSHLHHCKPVKCPAGMFKCRSGPCLDAARQCDGNIDCPETWDDEDFCPFQCSRKVPECQCYHLEANCSGLALKYFPDIEDNINRLILANNSLSVTLQEMPIEGHDNIVYLDLSRNNIQHLKNGTFRHLWRLRILLLSDNNITALTEGAFLGLHNLRTLHLNGNLIGSLGSLAFYGLGALPILDLSHQLLSRVFPGAFVGLRNLTTLTLSHNQLTVLDDAAFTGLRNLKKLDVTHNAIVTLSDKLLHHIPGLTHLETDEWRLCCLARHVEKCLPVADEFSSCEDLMSNLVLRVCIWILGFVALLGNSFVIIWRSVYSSGNKMHSFLIVNLGVGDLLMGVYLLIVAAVDLQYRGVYAAYELSWRTSSLCQLAGFISTFSSELSVFTLTVITVDRLIVIKFPFGVRRKEGSVIRMVMAGVWLVVGLLAALPLTRLQYFSNFYGRSGVCLALHITNEKPSGWEYAVVVFLVVNLVSFGVMAVSYVLMYVAARDTHSAARTDTDARNGHGAMAKRMSLIVATDAACWLPIIFLGIASLCGVTIPPRVFSWIAVFVLPLNAAINPVLYTLSTTPVRKKLSHLRQTVSSRNTLSASAMSGSRVASLYKVRGSTDVTDIVRQGDTNGRSSVATSPTSVFTTSTSLSPEAIPYVFTSPEVEPQEVVPNGPGSSLLLSVSGAAERVPVSLCPHDSLSAQECHQSQGPRGLEFVPLEELAITLPGAKKASSRKINRRKNPSDNRYD